MTTVHTYETITFDRAARAALAELGEAIRASDGDARCRPLIDGEPIDPSVLVRATSTSAVDALLASGIATTTAQGTVQLVVTIERFGGVLLAMPKDGWGPDPLFAGPDARYLVEAARALAPNASRLADLGTGTGVVAA